MVFLKRSTTALLTVLLFFGLSTIYSTKAHAEALPVQKMCPDVQFLVFGATPCTPLDTNQSAANFMPLSSFTPKIAAQDNSNKHASVNQKSKKTYRVDINLQSNTATLSAETLFILVNDYRNKVGLTSFEHEKNVCEVAQSRKYEMVDEVFVSHHLHEGFYAKNLPYFATENLIWQHSEAAALNWWLHSPVHKASIEGKYKYACGVCNGEVCNMVFTNYDPKVGIAPKATDQTAQAVQVKTGQATSFNSQNSPVLALALP